MVYTLRIPVVPVQHRPVRKASLCGNEDAMLAALDLFQTISYLQKLQGLKQKPEKWTKTIHIPGVDPGCISLKVNGGKVHLRALKETGDSENGETTEIRRTFALPENLNTEKMECKVSVNGVLKLEAPFRSENRGEEKENPYETPAKTGNDQKTLSQSSEKKIQNETETKSIPSFWKRRFCLKGFKTESLKVSVRDNLVTIEGEMKMSENDDASISLMKMISLPENVNVDNLRCHMNNEGTLELEAPFLYENKFTVSNGKEDVPNSTADNKNSHDQGEILNTTADDTNSHHQEEVLNSTADDTNSHDQGEILNTTADDTNSHHQEEVLNSTADDTNSHDQDEILNTTADDTNSYHQEEVPNSTADDTKSHEQEEVLNSTADDTNNRTSVVKETSILEIKKKEDDENVKIGEENNEENNEDSLDNKEDIREA